MSLAPSIRVSPDIVSEPLHIIVGLLVNDGGVGVLDNRPLARLNVMAFLVLKMLAGFEVDRVAKILRVSKSLEQVGSVEESFCRVGVSFLALDSEDRCRLLKFFEMNRKSHETV